jgi:predicted DNA-binding transcriptional regulator AlpA
MFACEHQRARETDVRRAFGNVGFVLRYMAMSTECGTCSGTPLAVAAKEVGKLLGISIRQVWRLNSCGKLPRPIRLGGSVRWRRDEIVAFVEAGCPDRRTWEAVRGQGGAA